MQPPGSASFAATDTEAKPSRAVRIASEYSVASQPGPYIASISDLIGQHRYDLVLPACGSMKVTVCGATFVVICVPVSSATRWPERRKEREACGSALAIRAARVD